MTSELAAFVLALPCGLITDPAQLAELVRQDPHGLVVLRCGGGRLLCPAQDVAHFRAIIEKEASDYIRDISVHPPTLALARHHMEAEAQAGAGLPAWHLAAKAAPLAGCAPLPKIEPLPAILPNPATRPETIADRVVWDESQCGGAFDGHQVTSDADPGL